MPGLPIYYGIEKNWWADKDRSLLVSSLPPHSLSTFSSSIRSRTSSGSRPVKPLLLCRSRRGSLLCIMSCEAVMDGHKNEQKVHHDRTICLHTFSDLSHVSPTTFVYLLKECYTYGTLKATSKFKVLQQLVLRALHNAPQPGPGSFIVQCLYILPLLGPPYTEGFSHLLISSLRRLQTVDKTLTDFSEAKCLASQLFLDILACTVIHEERILLKVLEAFNIGLEDIGEIVCGSDVKDGCLEMVKAHVEDYILGFIECQSYTTAATLMEHFSISQTGKSGQSFLLKMMQEKQFKAAEKWAIFMGKPMVCLLVQTFLDMKMLKNAYIIIKKNNLKQEFPDAHHLYKKSLLKKLAEKACWDIAEIKTNRDRELVEYLVCLAMEAGYMEKVDELCERYSVGGFIGTTVLEASPTQTQYLHVKDFVLDDILWVDEIDGLRSATSYIQGCKVVGIDCEWKPNYEKGSKPNKVSIMQIASEKRVFIFDLIKLYEDEPNELDNCFKSLFHSSGILKLGYNLHCDMHQLSHSYGNLECFRYYEMLLDIQKLFKEHRGGLSGLAKEILGTGLNKTRRNSNWEQRPLSQNQVEYAALDAYVLIHIFHHACNQPQPTDAKDGKSKIEWKSHIVCHMSNPRGRKKKY